jgi:flagellar biosynthesis protein FlhB
VEEKTEKPTPRKLKKAREKGDIASSSDLSFAVTFLSSLLLLWFFSSLFEARLQKTYTSILGALNSSEPIEALGRAFIPLFFPILALLLAIFFISLLSHLLQTGWIWSWQKTHKRKERRIIFPLLKLVVIALIGYFALHREKPTLSLILTPAPLHVIFKKIFSLLLKIGIALLLLGICDFIYQKWRHYKRMHMTPQELKDEKKEENTRYRQ